MMKLFLKCPTPKQRKPLKLEKQSSLLQNGRTPYVFSVILCFAILGCSGKNIHTNLKNPLNDDGILRRQWTLQTRYDSEAGDRGFEYSNPVLFEQALIFGNQSIGLTSLYPKYMQNKWELPIAGGVVSEVLLEKGVLYFGGGDGFLYACDADSGRVLWRYEVRNPLISKPTLAAGRLFVTTSDDTVYAFDATTGKWLWHYRRRSAPVASIHGASPPLVDGLDVLVGLSDGFMVALNSQDGVLKWERKLHQGTKFTDVDAQAVLDGDTIYMPSYDGALYALKRGSGEVLWRFDSGGSKQVKVEGDRLYLPSSEGVLYALQKQSGKVIWKFEMDYGSPTQVVLTDQYIIFGSSYQYLYVLNKATGLGLYRMNVGYGSGFAGAPLYDEAQKMLYLLSSAGNLYSFKVIQ